MAGGERDNNRGGGAPSTGAATEWYLARDGQQYGPISDVELRKLVDLKHLKPNDLLWHEGLPEWRPAHLLLGSGPPPRETPPPRLPSVQGAQAAQPVQPHAGIQQGPPPQAAPRQEMAQAAEAARPAGQPQAGAQGQPPAWTKPPGAHPMAGAPVQGQGTGQFRPGGQNGQGQHTAYGQVPAPAGGGVRPGGAMPGGAPGQMQTAPGNGRPVDSRHDPRAGGGQGHRGQRGKAGPVRPAQAQSQEYDDEDEETEAAPRRGWVWAKRVAVLLFFALSLSAAAWYAYPYRERILRIASAVAPFGGNSDSAAKVAPFRGFSADEAATDQVLQKAQLWRVLKRDFPTWYAERLGEAAQMARANQEQSAIAGKMLEAIVALRRKHAGDALSATPARLNAMAAGFADSLARLRSVSVDACFGMITAGEASPQFAAAIQNPQHTAALQSQLTTIFEAIAEGRRTPRVYPVPRPADYDKLIAELEALGWNQADMQLFSNSEQLTKAKPEKVCQMVTDWFRGHLAMKDADVQLRLIVDALKPVVAG